MKAIFAMLALSMIVCLSGCDVALGQTKSKTEKVATESLAVQSRVRNRRPVISAHPASLSVKEGQPASFTVKVLGVRPFTYRWYKDGSLVTRCTAATCSTAAATRADAGSYAVEVINSYGQVSSKAAVLTVTVENTVAAKSCMPNDVQDALNAAPAGATVTVPAGVCDWGNAPTVKRAAGIWLKGAGKGATVFKRTAAVTIIPPDQNPPNTHFMMQFDCTNGQKVEVSDIGFLGNDDLQSEALRLYDNDSGLELVNGCVGFKIHDTKFSKFSNTGLSIRGKSKGVVYSSEFISNFKCQPDPVSCLGYGVSVYGNRDWPALSLGSDNAVFIEDNVFKDNRHAVASNLGSQYVVRRNLISKTERGRNFGIVDAHGSSGGRGSRSWEIYQNTFLDETTTQRNTTPIGIRGGDGVIWGNTFPSTYHSVAIFSSETACTTSAGAAKTYPMLDQTTDAWLWDNIFSAPTLPMGNYYRDQCAAFFLLNRDYYLQAKPGYVAYTYPHPLRH